MVVKFFVCSGGVDVVLIVVALLYLVVFGCLRFLYCTEICKTFKLPIFLHSEYIYITVSKSFLCPHSGKTINHVPDLISCIQKRNDLGRQIVHFCRKIKIAVPENWINEQPWVGVYDISVKNYRKHIYQDFWNYRQLIDIKKFQFYKFSTSYWYWNK